MRKLKLLCLCLCITLLTGCWDSINVEERSMVIALGVDYVEEAPHYLITVSYPLVSPARTKEGRLQTVRAHSLADGYAQLNHGNSSQISFGKLLVTVFGEEAARQGVAGVINDLYKHPDIRTNSLVTVTKGTALDLLSVIPPDSQRIGLFLGDLLDWATFYRNTRATELFAFASTMMVHGMDAQSTIIGPVGTRDLRPQDQGSEGGSGMTGSEDSQGSESKQTTPQEDVQIMGDAVWYGDKMVGEINLPEAQHIALLQGQPRYMPLQILFEGAEEFAPVADRITVYLEHSAVQWKVAMINGLPQFKAKLAVQVTLYNYQGVVDITDLENAKVLQERMAETFRTNCLSVLQKVSSMGSDLLFLGQQIRLKYPQQWDPEKWQEVLKQADFDIDCEVTIRLTGYQTSRMQPKNGGQ